MEKKSKLKNFLKWLGGGVIAIFALIGLVLVGGYFALKWHWTDTLGRVDLNDRYFAPVASLATTSLAVSSFPSLDDECKLWVIRSLYPEDGDKLLSAYYKDRNGEALRNLVKAADLRLRDDKVYQNSLFFCQDLQEKIRHTPVINKVSWNQSEEWQSLQGAIIKDSESIKKASTVAGIKPRLLVSMLIVEQLRLFNSEREVFKQVFQPLKILGNQSQFSWGVMGLKEETARQVEKNLEDASSPFYLGPSFEKLLEFKTLNSEEERFTRLVNEDDHYYSYLYSAIFLRQILNQWQRAGFSLENRPEILATLFNLGFNKSQPKANPQVGGAVIKIGEREFTFGSLAYDFYYSGELMEKFPL